MEDLAGPKGAEKVNYWAIQQQIPNIMRMGIFNFTCKGTTVLIYTEDPTV